jgi:hypothetical protein
MLQKNDRIELEFGTKLGDQRWFSLKDEVDVVSRIKMASGVSEGSFVHFLDLLNLRAFLRKLRFEAFNRFSHGIFTAMAIQGHETFITVFHNVSTYFCSIVNVHRGIDPMLRYMQDGFHRSLDRVLHDFFFGWSEFTQNMIDDFLSALRSTNSDPETLKHFSEMVNHRPKPIMASVAATRAKPEPAQRQGDIVNDDENFFRGDLKISGKRPDSLAAAIHVGERFGEKNISPFSKFTSPTRGRREADALLSGERIDYHESDIVPRVSVLWARIS